MRFSFRLSKLLTTTFMVLLVTASASSAEGLKWSAQCGNYNSDSGPAVAADGTIYRAGIQDNSFPTPDVDQLCAFNPDGTLKWTYALTDESDADPTVGLDGTIYIGDEDNILHAVNPDGSVKWKYNLGQDVDTSSVAIALDGTLYVGTTGGANAKLVALTRSGVLKWTYSLGASTYSPRPLTKMVSFT